MRRLRTKNAPYISILSIGVEEVGLETPILTLSCGILTPEIRRRLESIETIHLTSLVNEFKIDALDKNGGYLGSLVRQDLDLAVGIYLTLKRRLENSEIDLRLFSILNPTDYVMKPVRTQISFNSCTPMAA